MSNRTIELMTYFLQVEEHILKLYKNINAIQGQYDQKIKTITTVMIKQCNKKIELYKTSITKAAEMDVEISQEGYDAVSQLLMVRREKIKNNQINNCKTVLAYAAANSDDLIMIFEVSLKKIKEHELERNQLRLVLSQLLDQEIKDNHALKHILNAYKEPIS